MGRRPQRGIKKVVIEDVNGWIVVVEPVEDNRAVNATDAMFRMKIGE